MDIKKVQLFTRELLNATLKTKDIYKIGKFLEEYGLCINEHKKIIPKPEYAKLWKMSQQYWDKQQLVKKISLA